MSPHTSSLILLYLRHFKLKAAWDESEWIKIVVESERVRTSSTVPNKCLYNFVLKNKTHIQHVLIYSPKFSVPQKHNLPGTNLRYSGYVQQFIHSHIYIQTLLYEQYNLQCKAVLLSKLWIATKDGLSHAGIPATHHPSRAALRFKVLNSM